LYVPLVLFVLSCGLLALALGTWDLGLGTLGLTLALAPLVLTEDQVKEFQSILGEMKGSWADLKNLPATFRSLQDETTQLKQHLNDVRRLLATRGNAVSRVRTPGLVTDECAQHLAAQFIVHCERSDKLEALSSLPAQRDNLRDFARSTLNLTTPAALNTTDIPLPDIYSGEVRTLISDFGVVRRRMSPYPIGMGTARPARTGTRPTFGSIAMSAGFGEKSPTLTFA